MYKLRKDTEVHTTISRHRLKFAKREGRRPLVHRRWECRHIKPVRRLRALLAERKAPAGTPRPRPQPLMLTWARQLSKGRMLAQQRARKRRLETQWPEHVR